MEFGDTLFMCKKGVKNDKDFVIKKDSYMSKRL